MSIVVEVEFVAYNAYMDIFLHSVAYDRCWQFVIMSNLARCVPPYVRHVVWIGWHASTSMLSGSGFALQWCDAENSYPCDDLYALLPGFQ